MSLKYTLLGFLNYGPQTGYDLKKHMDNSTQFFWHAHLGQIYPTLKKMLSEGFVQSVDVPQEGKPDKKVYGITEKGRSDFLKWLEDPIIQLTPTKDIGLLHLFFSGILEKKKILEQLSFSLTLHRKRLYEYQHETAAYLQEIIKETGLEREGMLWELARQFGEVYECAYIKYLEDAIEVIRKKMKEEPEKQEKEKK